MFLVLSFVALQNYAQPEDVDAIHAAAVKIEIIDEEDIPVESGSGVLVSEAGIIFTNLHVIDHEDSEDADKTFSLRVMVGDEAYSADVLYRGNQDPNNPSYFDFAIIEITGIWNDPFSDTSEVEFPYMQRWVNRIDIGDIVYTAGYPSATNNEFATQQAAMSSVTNPFPTFDRSISRGESGGLVYSENGELVGLLFQSGAGAIIPNRTEFLYIGYICDQIPEECEKYRPGNLADNLICQQDKVRPFCENSRLNVNMIAQIGSLESQVQLRQDPFWNAVWLKPLPRGAFVTIIGGPQATFDEVLRDFGFFWWQVRDNDGIVGWIPEDYFGEPLLIASDFDEFVVPAAICQLNTRTAANIRSGPGAEFDQIASRKNNQPLAADGQFNGSDGMIWWRLIDGFWVREDSVTENPTCIALPTVIP